MKRICLVLLTVITVITMSVCGDMTEVKAGNEENQHTIEIKDANSGMPESTEETEAYIHGNSLGIFPFDETASDDNEGDLEFTMETYVYKESFGEQIELDFYRPVVSDYDEFPVLVFYHGGGYTGGTKGDAARMFDDAVRGEIRKEYLRNGYAVVSCNYIVTDKDMGIDIEDCWIDGKDSIRWLRKNAEMLGIDASNIGVMGSSAGGGMATMLGYTEDDQFIGDTDLAEYSSSVNYVINMWGAAHYNVEPVDFRALESLDGFDSDQIDKMNNNLYRLGMTEEDDLETIQERSIELTPTTYLDAGDVPTISFYGEDDEATHASQGIFLHGELDELGIDNQLFIYEEEGHGLDTLTNDEIEEAKTAAFDFGHGQYKESDTGETDGIPLVMAEPTYTVLKDEDITYAYGLSHDETSTSSFATPLKLDVYYPDNNSTNRPVFMFIHGGGFKGGIKHKPEIVEMANYYASRGWVFVSIDYRTVEELGTLTGKTPEQLLLYYKGMAPQEWIEYSLQGAETPKQLQQSIAMYLAQRDSKAALRWIVANSSTYNINTDYITVGGASAGAISTIALGISNEEDFRDEISIADDPTLSTTNLGETYSVRSMVYFWGSNIKLDMFEAVYDLEQYDRYDSDDPELFMGHGEGEDRVTPYEEALELQSIYDSLGVYSELATLLQPNGEPAGHGAWDGQVDGKGLFELTFDFLVERQELNIE